MGIGQWKPKPPSKLGENLMTIAMILMVLIVFIWGEYAS